jgi:hypothetical protein
MTHPDRSATRGRERVETMLTGKWVLVAEGGDGMSRGAFAAVRALASAGYSPAVTVSERFSLAASSRYCARRVHVPSTKTNSLGYAEAVRRELASRPF